MQHSIKNDYKRSNVFQFKNILNENTNLPIKFITNIDSVILVNVGGYYLFL